MTHWVWIISKEFGALSNFDAHCDCGWVAHIATFDWLKALDAAGRHLTAKREPTTDELFAMMGA